MINKKSHILEVSLKLFAHKGFSATSMREIASKANVALGLTYNYFENKEALLFEILNQGNNDIKKITRIIKTKDDLKKSTEDFFNLIQTKYSYWRFFIQLLLNEKQNHKAFKKVSESIGNFMNEIDKGYQKYSSLQPNMSGVLLHGIIFEYMITGDTEKLKKNKNLLIEKI